MTITEDYEYYSYQGIAGTRQYHKHDKLVLHTYKRINNALAKLYNLSYTERLAKFNCAMLGRLKKLKNLDKIIIAIIILYDLGFTDLANQYESSIVLNFLQTIQ